MAKINAKEVAQKIKNALTLDGWNNVLTSIGIKGKDKRLSAQVKWERGNRDEFEHFYSADDVAGNIVDVVPEESLSKGYKIKGIDDQKLVEKVEARLKELKFDEKILEAWRLARIHGGAGMIKITEDAMLDLPMPAMKKILALNVVDRWDLFANSIDIDGQITSPTFRDPLMYSLQVSEGATATFLKIHNSRVVRFDGMYLPRRLMRTNQYWGDSILTKLLNPIRNYQISNDAAALTIQDFDIPVLKMKNLAELMSENCDDQVIKRLEMVNLSKSIAKMIVLDADKEDFEHKSRNVTGMKDVLDKIEARLVTASKLPRTKLFGEQVGGLGGGENENSNWYDYVESQQKNYLKPKMIDVIKHVVITEFPQVDASKIDIEFIPLWQESEKEEADRKKVVADTDAIYIDRGVVDPNEVAQSRFGGDKFSSDMKIDMKLREGDGGLPTPEPALITEPIPKAEPTVVEDKVNEEIKGLKVTVDSIAETVQKIHVAKKDKHADIIISKGMNYDSDVDILDRNGDDLDLKDYKFHLEVRDENKAIIEKYDLKKRDNKVQMSIPDKAVKVILGHKNKDEDSVYATASIVMTRTNGTKKVVKEYAVKAVG